MRRLAKRTLEAVLAQAAPVSLARSSVRERPLVLAYHNVVPDATPEFGDRSLHLPVSRFSAQLDELARRYDVVPLPSLLQTTVESQGRPRVAITFDDACRGAMSLGLAEVQRRGWPATVFVAPAFVGGRSFWWDAVAAADSGGLTDQVRAHAIEALRGEDEAVRRWAREAGYRVSTVPDIAAAADEVELHAAVRLPGITLGSHTWSHPNLARLDASELATELERPLAWLRERFGAAVIPWLAYPYGISSPKVEAAAGQAGYVGALAVSGGRFPSRNRSPFALPRLNVPAGLSRQGFVLRASGLLSR